ncbi:MAG: hypothetical protein QOG62_1595 [Thermoleophilaceae bacterium]|nr:hypothetical protein [Thermoleophilaceae bacterium]
MIFRLAAIGSALVIVVLALQPAPPARPGPAMVLLATTSGRLTLADSLQGLPVVTAAGATPGHDVGGQVKIKNISRGKLRLALARRRLADVPGPNGGRLSSAVRLEVRRVRKKRRGAGVVYRGSLARMPRVKLGPVGPRNSRKYHFGLHFPDGGTPPSAAGGDNAFQGSAFSVDFIWLTTPAR